jgi:hypothetical protein
MTSTLASLAPPASEPLAPPDRSLHGIRERLDSLSEVLTAAPDDLHDALDVRAQADLIVDYLANVNAARDLQIAAAECRLRAERVCGALLARHLKPGTSRAAAWRTERRGSAASPRLEEGVLSEFGLTSSMAASFELVASVPERAFEDALAASRVRNRPLSRNRLLVATGLRPTPTIHVGQTTKSLRHVLSRLRHIDTLSATEDVNLARRIAEIVAGWDLGHGPE